MNAERDKARLRLAVDELVDRGLLALEADPVLVDVRVEGRGFRYLAAFWEWTGRRARPEDLADARLRVGAEWVAAGAPIEWARTEAEAALAGLLRRFGGGA